MNFDQSLSYLLSLGHETLAMKLGLTNIELLLAALGNPQKPYPAVQIAGTNGKGSTATMLDSICREAGIRVGLFTSPHLIRITERVKINGQEISQAEFARLATMVRETVSRLLADGAFAAPPTFFEQVTAIAFLAFAAAQIELAILETGMGGRLDSTTAARAATIAITPIALDHQEYLGESLAEIAAEKAAIIRPGVCAIVAQQPAEAREVIRRRSDDCGVVPRFGEGTTSVVGAAADGRYRVTFQTILDRYQNVTLGLRGKHQVINADVAIRLAESLREHGFQIPQLSIIQGLEKASHAGRLELRPGHPSLLFDGAHNPAGARALRKYLDEFVSGSFTLIFGAMHDKDLLGIATELFPPATLIVLTRPNNPRAATLAELATLILAAMDPARVTTAATAATALRRAYELTPPEGLICVSGSLYLIGEIQTLLSQSSDAEFANLQVRD